MTAALYRADSGGNRYLAPLPFTHEAAGSSAISAECEENVVRCAGGGWYDVPPACAGLEHWPSTVRLRAS